MSRSNLALIMATMAGMAAASGIPPEAFQRVHGAPDFPKGNRHSGVARMKRQAAKARRRG